MFALTRLAVGLGPLNAPGAACTVRPDPSTKHVFRFTKCGSPAGLIPIRPFSRQRTAPREMEIVQKVKRGRAFCHARHDKRGARSLSTRIFYMIAAAHGSGHSRGMNPLRCTLLLAAIFLFLSPLAQAESPQITWSRAPGEQYDTLTLDGKAIPEDVDGDSEKFLAAAGHDHNLNIEILIPDGAWNPDAPSVTWPRLQGGAVKFFQSLTARWALSYRYGRTPLSRHFMVCKLDGAELTYETGKDQFVSWS